MKKRRKEEGGRAGERRRVQPHSAATTSDDKALQESEERFRSLVKSTAVPIGIISLAGDFTFANEALADLTGYTVEELVGRPFMGFLHPEDREAVLSKFMKRVSTSEETPEIEFRVKRRDGRILTLTSKPTRFEIAGKTIGFQAIITDITERKRAEEELRNLSQFRESIIDNANIWIDVLDEKANIVVWNTAAELISGYSREEVVGHGQIWEWLYPDANYRKELTDLVADVIQRGRVEEDFETSIRRKDGQIRIMSWNERNLTDELGKVIGSIAIGRDVTEHKRMEEELKRYSTSLEQLVLERTQKLARSERRFRELADLLPQIVFETDETGKVTFGNRAGFAITGYTQEDLDSGFNVLQLFLPEDRAKVRDRIMRTLGGERSSGTEYRVQRKDGITFPVIIFTAAALRDGKAVGLRGIAIDITDRKRAEEELRAAKEQLDYVVTSNPAVIFTGKPRSDLSNFDATYLSKSVVSLLGFEPEEYVEIWNDRVHPEDVHRYLAEVPLLWKDGRHTFEYRFLHKDGTYRWIREEAKVVRDAAGKPMEVTGYWTDVTERKRLEARLAESQRLAGIGEAAAMVGHDLRNPLQGIVSTVYLAKRKLESREPSREAAVKRGLVDMLETIENEAEYMDKIVSDLQDYAAPLKAELKPVEMEPLVKDTLSKIPIPRNAKVSFKVSESLSPVMADPAIMRRVFSNLIMNAIQAMSNEGELSIDLYGTDESLFIAFKDTGMGIPEENMGKLFDPFFTTKAKGQGLGLSACKRLVEACGGRITVKSKLGEGSTFTVELPFIKP